jgi:hypothetical protein
MQWSLEVVIGRIRIRAGKFDQKNFGSRVGFRSIRSGQVEFRVEYYWCFLDFGFLLIQVILSFGSFGFGSGLRSSDIKWSRISGCLGSGRVGPGRFFFVMFYFESGRQTLKYIFFNNTFYPISSIDFQLCFDQLDFLNNMDMCVTIFHTPRRSRRQIAEEGCGIPLSVHLGYVTDMKCTFRGFRYCEFL